MNERTCEHGYRWIDGWAYVPAPSLIARGIEMLAKAKTEREASAIMEQTVGEDMVARATKQGLCPVCMRASVLEAGARMRAEKDA